MIVLLITIPHWNDTNLICATVPGVECRNIGRVPLDRDLSWYQLTAIRVVWRWSHAIQPKPTRWISWSWEGIWHGSLPCSPTNGNRESAQSHRLTAYIHEYEVNQVIRTGIS